MSEGWQGWDAYAPFYDWENARTLGRRDVAFWKRIAKSIDGDLLELGCGTGRLLAPMARVRAGAGRTIGIDRSEPMLDRARRRLRRMPVALRPALIRGDVRTWPFRPKRFKAVVAAYGLLQSLVRDADVNATLDAAAAGLSRGGLLAIDLVPDLSAWEEYERRIPLKGRLSAGTTLTLVESVRQDRRKGLTIFDEQYIVRTGRTVRRHEFQLTFRTLPMDQVLTRLERVGFRIDHVLGGYRGEVWHPEADTWVILARKR
ncbi:MAG: class I SAM-dependent methyltransferase [Acidimicrobiia bacterium]|nr:class I SAM-dependent methyltransferase [Acidimicrobiia bacterium]